VVYFPDITCWRSSRRFAAFSNFFLLGDTRPTAISEIIAGFWRAALSAKAKP
jgi:hypothetical protein